MSRLCSSKGHLSTCLPMPLSHLFLSGAFSNVYKAIDRRTNSKVAIKCVRKFELNHSQVGLFSLFQFSPPPAFCFLPPVTRTKDTQTIPSGTQEGQQSTCSGHPLLQHFLFCLQPCAWLSSLWFYSAAMPPLLSIVTSSARIAARFLSAEKLRREAVCSYSDSWTTASLDVDGISLPGLHSLRY